MSAKAATSITRVERRAGIADQETKRQALRLYLEGLGYRALVTV